jgi:hypothetical protein
MIFRLLPYAIVIIAAFYIYCQLVSWLSRTRDTKEAVADKLLGLYLLLIIPSICVIGAWQRAVDARGPSCGYCQQSSCKGCRILSRTTFD